MNNADFLKGAAAGLVATGPMTISMETMHKFLPPHEKYWLPPKQITTQIAHKTGIKLPSTVSKWDPLTVLSHFSYGAATGVLYPTVAKKVPLSPLISGPIYGFMVWAVNYLILLPLIRLLRPATKNPRDRNVVMIVAHLVWGLGLGLVLNWLQPSASEQKPDAQK
jgi:uncharacterized membrane protein YagU involved in acid resistance